MSDWSMFELEDISWDVLGDSCDGVVPHKAGQVNSSEVQGDSHKKARHDLGNVNGSRTESKGCTIKDVLQRTEETIFQSSLTVETSQLADNSTSQTFTSSFSDALKSVFPLSHVIVSGGEDNTLASDDTGTSDSCFNSQNVDANCDDLFSDDPTLGNIRVRNEGNLCHFSLDISPAGTDLDFLEKGPKNKENSDILDYEWPDVGSLSDVDRMLSYTTFGQGSPRTADEPSWFLSSSYSIDGSEGNFRLGFKSSCSELTAVRNLSQDNLIIWPENGMLTADTTNSDLDYGSFTHWLESDAQYNVDFASKGQVEMQSNDSQDQQPLQNMEKDRPTEYDSGGSDNVLGTVTQYRDTSPFINASETYFQHLGGHRNHSQKPDSSICTHPHIEVNQSYCRQVPTMQSASCIRSPEVTKPSLSIHIPVQASSKEHHFLKKILDPLPQFPTVFATQKIQEMHLGQQPHPRTIEHHTQKHANPSGLMKKSLGNTNLNKMENKVGCNGQLEKVSRDHDRIDMNSSFRQGSSCTTWSENALSSPKTLQQLQNVMNQLDIRTKLCIRDGLYRLARNSEQRHSVENPMPGCRETIDSSIIIGTDMTKRCRGFMDVDTETGTNAIDRSIAHLLFRQASDIPSSLNEDAMSHINHI